LGKYISLTQLDQSHQFTEGTFNMLFSSIEPFLEKEEDYKKQGRSKNGNGVFITAGVYFALSGKLPKTNETIESIRNSLDLFKEEVEAGSNDLEECICRLREAARANGVDLMPEEKEKERDYVRYSGRVRFPTLPAVSPEAYQFATEMLSLVESFYNKDERKAYWKMLKIIRQFSEKKKTPTPSKRLIKEDVYRYIGTYFISYKQEFEEYLYDCLE